MKVFISADLEGATGVTAWDKADEVVGMIADVNAAVEGALAAGATEVVVRDAHETARNLPLDKVHPRARLLRGWADLALMMEGLDESYDAAFLVGYHARAMTETGVLAHTMSDQIRSLRIGGIECGEYGISAVHAGHFGVPVVLACGDQDLAGQVVEFIPGIETVAVKSGLTRTCALSLSAEQAREAIQAAAQRALARRTEIAPCRPEAPLRVELELADPRSASVCALVPGTERVGRTAVRCEAEHGLAVAQVLGVYLKLMHG